MPGEYRVSVGAPAVDVDVSSIAWPTVVDAPAHSTVRAGLVPPVAAPLPPASVVDSPPALAIGTDSANAFATQPPMLACVCDDLGSDVPIAVKEKVWKGEFVDLGIFLKRGLTLSALSEETAFSLVQAGVSLQVRQTSRAPRIANIEQWTTAFLTYASIFVEKHFGRARELFKYIDTIRSIVRFGGYNWRAYDVQFRLRQARQPHRSWSAIDTELWLTVATAQPRGGFQVGGRPQAQPFRGGQGSGVPATNNQSHAGPTSSPAGGGRAGQGFNRSRANHCFAFNAGTCQRGACRFAHVCANCGSASHAAVACTRGTKGGTGGSQQGTRSHPH